MHDDLMRRYDLGDRRAVRAVNQMSEAEFKQRWDRYSQAVLRSQRRRARLGC